jgi:phosphatidate cytidylyltransferase
MRLGAATDGLAALAPEARARTGVRREVILRVASAAVLAPLGLWSVHAGGVVLMIATGLCAVLASAEWTQMAAKAAPPWAKALFHIALAAGAAGAVALAGRSFELVAIASLGAAAAAALIALISRVSIPSMAFGAIYVSFPFGAFVWIRELHMDGRLFLFALLAIVWATDIAAYFAGRGFGGPLLSPKDSPNKTWTGAIGALVCACLAGAAVARASGGDFTHWLLAGLVLSIVAQAGDLLESRFKRLFGVKDTSGIVPGHGGVLDRLDALMAAVVISALTIRFLPALVPGFAGVTGG